MSFCRLNLLKDHFQKLYPKCLSLYFFVDTLGFGKLIGKLFGSLIMFVFNYLTNKFVVFKIKD